LDTALSYKFSEKAAKPGPGPRQARRANPALLSQIRMTLIVIENNLQYITKQNLVKFIFLEVSSRVNPTRHLDRNYLQILILFGKWQPAAGRFARLTARWREKPPT
jgi:hypothetical protein